MPSSGTSHSLEIFSLSRVEIGRSERQTIASGWIPRRPQLGDRVLCGLGLLLAGRADERHQGHVDVEDVLPADVLAELPDGLQERKDLDVADRAADLGDDDVDVVVGQSLDAVFDLVGDVGDHLHGGPEVVAPPLLGEHRRIDRAGGGVGVAVERDVDEALVVPQVEVALTTVVGDEHLAVLERVHRAGIEVDVRIELLHRDPQTPAFEQPAEGRGRQPLPEAGRDTTRHEDVLRQDLPPFTWVPPCPWCAQPPPADPASRRQ